MRRFNFNLQTVLKVRQQTEKRQKQEYFDQKRRLHEECRRLEDLEETVRKSAAEAKERACHHFDVTLEQAYCDYLQMLQGRIRRSREIKQGLEEELKRRLAVLIQARKAVKVLEKLRERKVEAYRKDARRTEQKYFDEVALLRHQIAEDA